MAFTIAFALRRATPSHQGTLSMGLDPSDVTDGPPTNDLLIRRDVRVMHRPRPRAVGPWRPGRERAQLGRLLGSGWGQLVAPLQCRSSGTAEGYSVRLRWGVERISRPGGLLDRRSPLLPICAVVFNPGRALGVHPDCAVELLAEDVGVPSMTGGVVEYVNHD